MHGQRGSDRALEGLDGEGLHVQRRGAGRVEVVATGSTVSGRTRPDSDVDIAVLADALGDDAERALVGRLSRVTGTDVDLIRLEQASTVLRWQVATKGIPLIESRAGTFARFRAAAASEYLDFEPALTHYGEIFRQRLAERGSARWTDRAIVLAKLTTLREHAARMSRRRPDTLAAFATDTDRQDVLSMSLMVALQEAVDIALHIASDEAWGVPTSCAGAFQLLAAHAVIEPALAERMAGLAALRNRVAHGYGSLDFERLWRETPSGVEAFGQFAAAIARFIED